MDKKELGRKGEALARRHYEEHGYHVLAMNYRTRLGEVDVIAQRGSLYVFCEVKARSVGPYAQRDAVTPAKQRRLMRAAQHYVVTQLGREVEMRFDVAEVIWQEGNFLFRCIENAFSF